MQRMSAQIQAGSLRYTKCPLFLATETKGASLNRLLRSDFHSNLRRSQELQEFRSYRMGEQSFGGPGGTLLATARGRKRFPSKDFDQDNEDRYMCG
jgi:hypothetical protein